MSTWTITADDGTTTTAWDIALTLIGDDGIDDVHRLHNGLVRVTADNGEELVFGLESEWDDDRETIAGWTYSCYHDDEEGPYAWTTDGDIIETTDDIDTRVIATIRQWAASIAAEMKAADEDQDFDDLPGDINLRNVKDDSADVYSGDRQIGAVERLTDTSDITKWYVVPEEWWRGLRPDNNFGVYLGTSSHPTRREAVIAAVDLARKDEGL